MKSARHLAAVLLAGALCMAVTACLHVGPAPTPTAMPAEAYRDPDALRALLAKGAPAYLLVDVRTADEFAAGHIPTAINIPVDTIAARPPSPDTSALIIVYCASGHRSAMAASALTRLGYTRVADFGSISRWKWALVDSDQPGEAPSGP
jgi:phage shock protein E